MARKKVNKFNPKNWAWKKISAVAGVGLVGFMGAGLGVGVFNEPAEKVDMSKFASKADLNDTNNALADVAEIAKSTNEIVVENDMWESTAEVLATDELEHKDYRDLRKWVLTTFNDSSEDYDEIEDFEVTVKDVDVKHYGFDVNDKNAEVVFDLKVEYENNESHNVNRYITATATIEDGDVEDLVFS